MKVLVESRSIPFFLAHGGEQIQVLRTVGALKSAGLNIDFTRWWDAAQEADLIHSFGTPALNYIEMAHKKKIGVVNTTLFTATCNRSTMQLRTQGAVIRALLGMPNIPPWSFIRGQLKWESFRACDCNVVGLEAERKVLKTVYGVPDEKIEIVPLGISEEFLAAGHGSREGDYLVTTGTITPRKRSVELARMALDTKTPLCFVGKPYDFNDPYWHDFASLVDDRYVRHIHHTDNVYQLIDLLKAARGYVLYSDYENWCLAAHEAIACGLPVLVPDQPWSRERFGDQACYFTRGDRSAHARDLGQFGKEAKELPVPNIALASWDDVAVHLKRIYADVAARVR